MAWLDVVDAAARRADEWTKAKRAADPAWTAIEPRVIAQIKKLLKERAFPTTANAVTDLCEEALASVHHQAPRPAAGS